MNKLPIYQVDAFASKLFTGNPAAVCPLEEWLPDETLQAIAEENNLSETAYFVKNSDHFHIRWFTPNSEVDLCGHATLAAAHVIFNHLGYTEELINFQCRSGKLMVKKSGESLKMNFPADEIKPLKSFEELSQALGIEVKEAYQGVSDIMVVIESEDMLVKLKPDFRALKQASKRGVIVTAKGDNVDFVSRCFYPAVGIDEDPVTGSAHTTMTPYWAKRLEKNDLVAIQLSSRSGKVHCTLLNDRVELSGQAITYLEGTISI
ncbi:MAG: PhzF family phenazine biosynthesis protein [Fulvivirga sp.]